MAMTSEDIGRRTGRSGGPRLAVLLSACLALAGASLPARAAESGGRLDPVTSLELGGRAIGMGGAYVAVADDADSFLYNPAGLARSGRISLTATQLMLFQDTSFSAMSVVYPTLRRGSFGVSMARLQSGAVEQRDENNELQGSVEFSEMALRLGYGFPLSSRFLVGGNLTSVRRSFAGDSTGFYGLDAGMQYVWRRNVFLGMSMQNVLTRSSGDTDDELPQVVRAGVGYGILDNLVLVSGQFDLTPTMEYHVGLEYTPMRPVSLRLGREPQNSVLGAALRYRRFSFDYAMMIGDSDLGNSQRLSMSVAFGAEKRDRKRDMASEIRRRVQIYYQEGMYRQALQRTREAQRLDAESEWIDVLLPRLEKMSEVGLKEMTGKDGYSASLRRVAKAFLEGDDDTARKVLVEALKERPDSEEAQKLAALYKIMPGGLPTGPGLVRLKLYSAELHFNQGQYEAAAKDCSVALQVDPRNADAYVKLGSAYYAMGLVDEAVTNWKKARDIDAKLEAVREANAFMKAKGLE